MSDLSAKAIVIPAFNEIRTIRDVAQRALAQLPTVIVVDDGSTDGTASALDGLAVVVVRNGANLGKAASLRAGAEEAIRLGAVAIITLDGDGQHRPEDIPRLLEAHAAAPDRLVIGSRLHAKGEIPTARYRANRFANFWISWAAGYPIVDSQSGFRIYPAWLFSKVRVNSGKASSFVFESQILIEAARLGVQAICVPVQTSYSAHARASHFRPVVDIARITRMVAWSLITRGLYLPGLLRSLRRKPATVA